MHARPDTGGPVGYAKRMRFDLFYELAVPEFAGRSELQVFQETLTELAHAEQCGFRTAWFVEHHFMREYSHSSAPDLFLAAAAQRTERLRLGHAIVPLTYHHPVHVAERIATLDNLSGGRVEFGFGRGFSPREYAAFGVSMRDSRGLVEESLEVLRRAFVGPPLRYAGKHFHLDNLDVLPKVVQRPHPPLWMAAVSPESFELAAKLGVGVLAGPFKPWFMVKQDIVRYRTTWRATWGESNPDPGLNPRVGVTVGLFCLENGKRAREIAGANITWFYRELIKHTAPLLETMYESYEYYAHMRPMRALLGRAIRLPVLQTLGMVVAGDPGHCVKRIETYRKAGVDHLLCAIGAGGSPSQLVIESMRTLSKHVIPRLQ